MGGGRRGLVAERRLIPFGHGHGCMKSRGFSVELDVGVDVVDVEVVGRVGDIPGTGNDVSRQADATGNRLMRLCLWNE